MRFDEGRFKKPRREYNCIRASFSLFYENLNRISDTAPAARVDGSVENDCLDAADVTGQVFMTMGKFIGRYSIPTIAGAMFADGTQWTVEEAGKKAENLFKPMPAPPFGAPPAE